ncbi:MAG: hypothetical protein OEY25_07125 [Candidatus Aminicenantes bacterium]|nr:hypothetical protein [Candidatus Aminicenantes bacterium]MDH5707281.1 hypothetical protein [Candidatus Aminicenantes bacterium]
MSCNKLKRYELGKLGETEFERHLETCSSCQERMEQDTRLMALSRSLKRPAEPSHLWDRIAKSLEEEQQKELSSGVMRPRWRPLWLLPAAVVVLLAVVIGLYFFIEPGTQKSGLLADSALARVEKKENEYVKAIDGLEQLVLPRMADMNLELTLLYRDKLETIDDQIEQCREALAENPANAHIRRYMLAALQDKKQTLMEIRKTQKNIQE